MPAGQFHPSLCSVALGGLSSNEAISPRGSGGDNRTIRAPARMGHGHLCDYALSVHITLAQVSPAT